MGLAFQRIDHESRIGFKDYLATITREFVGIVFVWLSRERRIINLLKNHFVHHLKTREGIGVIDSPIGITHLHVQKGLPEETISV
jgi:hypothetical protein